MVTADGDPADGHPADGHPADGHPADGGRDAVLRVRTADPTPPFEQVRRQVAEMIVTGVLEPGARLPPLRQLAGDLGLAVGTVARAYRELERGGLVVGRRGGGTRVRQDVDRPAAGRRDVGRPSATVAALDAHIAPLLDEAARLGVADDAVREAVDRALSDRAARHAAGRHG